MNPGRSNLGFIALLSKLYLNLNTSAKNLFVVFKFLHLQYPLFNEIVGVGINTYR